ncbi:MAG: hypothetical protein U9R36_02625 [Elusimicrobiota bacterium]|nr:hypothetical protein [Elusimicrobiota bacterium]
MNKILILIITIAVFVFSRGISSQKSSPTAAVTIKAVGDIMMGTTYPEDMPLILKMPDSRSLISRTTILTTSEEMA